MPWEFGKTGVDGFVLDKRFEGNTDIKLLTIAAFPFANRGDLYSHVDQQNPRANNIHHNGYSNEYSKSAIVGSVPVELDEGGTPGIKSIRDFINRGPWPVRLY